MTVSLRWHLTRSVRMLIPRALRNLARNPRATVRWFRQETANQLGYRVKCAMRDDWKLTCHPVSSASFCVYARQQEFRDELSSFVERCTASMILLDIGSHFGIFTLAALRYGGPGARAIAVDPSAYANRILRANLRLAGEEVRAEVLQIAVGSSNGTLPMLTTGPAGNHFLLSSVEARSDALLVPVCTVAALVERAGLLPTHVKIDVEGDELEVLKGAEILLRERAPIIFLELHNAIHRNKGRDPMAAVGLLRNYGYTEFYVGHRLFNPANDLTREVTRIVAVRSGAVSADRPIRAGS